MRSVPIEAADVRIAIGSRIRAARLQRQMTIDEVATAAGLTRGFLSRVERDLASPSVSTLVLLCDVLSLEVGSLFQAPDVRLIRRDERLRLNLGGVDSDDRLISPRRESRLQVIRSTIRPGGHGGDERYALTADVEVVHVLAGSLDLEFSSDTVRLGEGDTLTFDGREPHTWRVVGDVEAEVLWVLSPSLWSA
jgi:transcriptional regulator with XRE-family HTH domain